MKRNGGRRWSVRNHSSPLVDIQDGVRGFKERPKGEEKVRHGAEEEGMSRR